MNYRASLQEKNQSDTQGSQHGSVKTVSEDSCATTAPYGGAHPAAGRSDPAPERRHGYVQGSAAASGWQQTDLYTTHTAQDTAAVTGTNSASSDESAYGENAPASNSPHAAELGMDAFALWQKVLGELQLQLASSTYYTWLHNTWVEAYEDGDLIIGTANTYARDWLDNRLKSVIRRTLKSIAGRTMDVRFIVRSRELQDTHIEKRAPLYTLDQQPASENQQRTPDQNASSNSINIQSYNQPQNKAHNQLYSQNEIMRPTAPDNANFGSRTSTASAQLNNAHTFESFIIGSNNRLACAAAQAVAERPGYKFNPLFVHGGVGLGKTHLMHAIGNTVLAAGYSVLYVTSEQFTNDLIMAIRSNSTEQFRNKYRELDVLLIDDIQFIAGKESTQEEVFHTFNHLQQAGKQIVLSSDRPPKALQLLEERLRSRFEGGIRVDVSAPDYETRVAILQSKAIRMGITVGADVLALVAERVDSNIRELEGALNHLFLQSQMARMPLDLPMATSTLEHVAPHRKPCSPGRMIEIVAEQQKISVEDIVGARRTKPLADARHIAMYLLREDAGLSLPQIGALFGGRDHTTVAHGVSKISGELRKNDQLRHHIAVLRERIYVPFAG